MTASPQKSIVFHRCFAVLALEFLGLLFPAALILSILSLTALPKFDWVVDNLNLVAAYRLLCLAILLEIARRYFNDVYVLAQRGAIHFHGQLSLRRRKASIYYSDIREIEVRQTLPGRILNYGTLVLGTASKDAQEMELRDIASPHKFAGLVAQLLGPQVVLRGMARTIAADNLPGSDD